MAHTLTITHGSTTITLTLVDNTPASAPASQPTVTESWEVHLSGASKSALQTKIQEINRAFELARQHQKDDFFERVYLNFQPAGYASSYRSEILDGSLVYYDETLKWAWANTAFDVRLIITRRNYWEGAETTIPLTNSNGTDVTTGLDMFNNADGTGVSPTSIQENYADIDADDLAGDLPAPLKLKFSSTGALNDIIACLNRSGTPSTLPHMAEGEDAISASEGVDATCSGGKYGIRSFDNVDAAVNVFMWGNGLWPNLEIGRWYLPIMRLRTVPSISDLWTRVQITTGITKDTGWMSYPDSGGPQIIQYPPIRLGFPKWQGEYYLVRFQFKTSTSGTKTMHCDYVYLLPLDGVRFYTVSLTAGYVMDDPYEGFAYKYETGDSMQYMILAEGDPLMVDPRHDARIYFMSTGSTAPININVDLIATYRPRRLAL